ncbi:zinc finger and SCAN domain-containing protein 21-like isoform X1 [Phycodurus eques]|uniref:zinc finger and SCAN domain-containing protein 21-like isoform X1 n=1 Tax=Phycodurus eques TaxID=693459 RepID=UPI002ACE5BBC|nr:zinc finger and SCAN domain-containing protein 21-like isoform X1 [Phycodurus eques]
MCKVRMLRALVNQQLNTAVEEIFVVLERTLTEYEDELCRTKEENERQRKLLDALFKARSPAADLAARQQEWCSRMERKEPEPPLIKVEEDVDVCSSQEAEQQEERADVAKYQVTSVIVKSEDDAGGRARSPEENAEARADVDPRVGVQPHGRLARVTRSQRAASDLPNPRTAAPGDAMTAGSTLSGLNCAQRERHPSGKPFVCPFCCKTFNQRVHLSRHLSVHTGDKPFHCTVCSKMFATRDRLRSHMRIHTGEKPFSCSVCTKRFFHRSHLVKHSHIHTGVKPFSCLFCGKRFYSNGDLIKHTRTHTGEKPFTCSICNTSFSDSSTLGKHKRRHTGEKPFSCNVCDKRFPFKFQVKKHKCVGENSSTK